LKGRKKEKEQGSEEGRKKEGNVRGQERSGWGEPIFMYKRRVGEGVEAGTKSKEGEEKKGSKGRKKNSDSALRGSSDDRKHVMGDPHRSGKGEKGGAKSTRRKKGKKKGNRGLQETSPSWKERENGNKSERQTIRKNDSRRINTDRSTLEKSNRPGRGNKSGWREEEE